MIELLTAGVAAGFASPAGTSHPHAGTPGAHPHAATRLAPRAASFTSIHRNARPPVGTQPTGDQITPPGLQGNAEPAASTIPRFPRPLLMKRLLFPCVLACLGTVTLRAGPVENAIVAAMKLAEKPSYSWVSHVEDDVRAYDVIGMTQPDGFTRLKMPMTESIRRKLGRSAVDSMVDVIFRGKTQCVVATVDGWKSLRELPWLVDRKYEANFAGVPSGGLSLGLPGHAGNSMTPPPPRRVRRSRAEMASVENYSSLQLGVSHPHEELSVIVSSHASLQCELGTAHGTLNDIGALLLLVPDDRDDIQPIRAGGTFKLWIRDGIVTRYQVRLEGELVVGGRTFEVHQSRTTMLKDIGVTKFQVPDEARQKLGE